jgi:hypothetical protein
MILGVFFEPVPMVMVSGRSHFCLRSCLLFSRRGPRHGVVSPVSQTKWDWNLVLLNELFRLVLISRESVHWLAHDPLFSRWGLRLQSGLSHVSDKVRLEPSAFRWALSFGPSFKGIGPLAGLQSAIQSSPPQARGGLTCLSEKVRLEPSADWWALSFGSTFEGIRPLVSLQTTIQPIWGPRHRVVSLVSQTKWDQNLVLIDKTFHLVLLSSKSAHWLACNSLFSR